MITSPNVHLTHPTVCTASSDTDYKALTLLPLSFLAMCPLCWIGQACSAQDHLQGAGGEPAYQAEAGHTQPSQLKQH